nr:MAG TPA: hypothetical protein [Caudoviricetes sp.]
MYFILYTLIFDSNKLCSLRFELLSLTFELYRLLYSFIKLDELQVRSLKI